MFSPELMIFYDFFTCMRIPSTKNQLSAFVVFFFPSPKTALKTFSSPKQTQRVDQRLLQRLARNVQVRHLEKAAQRFPGASHSSQVAEVSGWVYGNGSKPNGYLFSRVPYHLSKRLLRVTGGERGFDPQPYVSLENKKKQTL